MEIKVKNVFYQALSLVILVTTFSAHSIDVDLKWKTLREGVTYQLINLGHEKNQITAKEVISYDSVVTLEDGTETKAWGEGSKSSYLAASLFSMDSLPIPLLADMVIGESRVYRVHGEEFEKEDVDAGKARLITLTVTSKQPQIPAPRSVATIPQVAIPLPEGSGFIYLSKGSEVVEHPTLSDDIEVHYTGWNAAGEMFDSSTLTGESATFPLSKVIKGYQALLPKMVRGDKVRAWFTSKMAYGHRPQYEALQGTLVFDIELVDFKPTPSDKIIKQTE